MSNTYCPLPWNHFSAHADGSMRVCCGSTHAGKIKKPDGSIYKINEIENVMDFYNTDQMKTIRKRMLAGERTPECTFCYNIEDNGGVSVRQSFVKDWPMDQFIDRTDMVTGEINKVEVQYFDLSWTNKCNLQCRMCTPPASDQLIKEFNNLKLPIVFREKTFDYKDTWDFEGLRKIFNEVIGPELDRILVTGGEPLINNDFYLFCKELIESGMAKNISLSFHTNLTVMPSKWFDLWKDFKEVNYKVSIDGVEDVYEYIRYPGKWNIVKGNIEELVENIHKTENVSLEFHTVMSVFNTEKFTNLLDFIFNVSKSDRVINIPHVNLMYNPAYTTPCMAPDSYKLKFANEVREWISKIEPEVTLDSVREKISILESILEIMLNTSVPEFNRIQHLMVIKRVDEYRGHMYGKFMPWVTK